jgi:hypothetical protein
MAATGGRAYGAGVAHAVAAPAGVTLLVGTVVAAAAAARATGMAASSAKAAAPETAAAASGGCGFGVGASVRASAQGVTTFTDVGGVYANAVGIADASIADASVSVVCNCAGASFARGGSCA